MRGIATFLRLQISACLFGLLMLGALVGTHFIQIPGIARYDFLFVYALVIQILLIVTKQEDRDETKAICLFHLVGTAMELYKTSEGIGAWSYPESNFFRIGGVPLFSGFMYASVGSYIARCWKFFGVQLKRYPPTWLTIVLSLLIYGNFFTDEFWYDIRWWLCGGVFLLWGRTTLIWHLREKAYRLPLVLLFLVVGGLLYIAENIGTITQTWLYPQQLQQWTLVSFEKFISWFLLLIISFVMVKGCRNEETVCGVGSTK